MSDSMILIFTQLAVLPLRLVFLLLLMLLVILPLGLYLLITGFRGKLLDDHPICRACQFDLTGKSEDRSSCPECGADLSDPKKIIHGNRVQSDIKKGIGVIMLGMAVGFLCVSGFLIAQPIDWLSKAPFWYLRKQINANASNAKDAWIILNQRYDTLRLSPSQVQLVVGDAFTLQADPTRPWVVDAGMLVEKSQIAGTLQLADWQNYVRNAVTQSHCIKLRDAVAHGQLIPVRLVSQSVRVGGMFANGVYMWCHTGHGQFFLDDKLVEQNIFSGGGTLSADSSGSMGTVVNIKDKFWQQITTGKHVVKLKQRFYVYPCIQAQTYDRLIQQRKYAELESMPDVVFCDMEFESAITILPAGTITVNAVMQPEGVALMQQAASVRRLEFTPQTGNWEGVLKFNFLPMSIAHDVILCIDQKQYVLGGCSIYGPANSGGYQYGVGKTFKDLIGIRPQSVDIMLVPGQANALNSVDITEYWGGEIRIKDVPVTIVDR